MAWIQNILIDFVQAKAIEQAEFALTILGLFAGAAAWDAARHAKSRMITVDSVGEVSKALSKVEEIRKFNRTSVWIYLPDLCTELRHILVTLNSQPLSLSKIHREGLQTAISETREIEEAVNARNPNALSATESRKAERSLRNLSDTLNEISVKIKKEANRGS